MPISKCNVPVIFHGRRATMKGVKNSNGEKLAEIWQGSAQYFIPLEKVRYA